MNETTESTARAYEKAQQRPPEPPEIQDDYWTALAKEENRLMKEHQTGDHENKNYHTCPLCDDVER